jgi:hypothetical protein
LRGQCRAPWLRRENAQPAPARISFFSDKSPDAPRQNPQVFAVLSHPYLDGFQPPAFAQRPDLVVRACQDSRGLIHAHDRPLREWKILDRPFRVAPL